MKKITLLLSLLISSIGFSQELVTNGDFQTGVAAPWTGNAANPVDLGGGNYFNQANVSTAGAAYAVNLWQEILLNDGTTYTLTFDAFTDTDTGSRTILAGLGQTGAPYEALTETVNLTPTSQTFTYTFTINYGDAVTDRVLFDMGADIGYVFIDNVSVQEFVDTEAPTDFTASVGTVGATSVELLLNATDNSGSVTYDVTYGATTTQATGVSGVETSVTINGLTPETAYTFSVSASDSSSNVAANNPIELPATTVEDTNTACAGTSSSAAQGSFGGSTFDYAFETLTNGNVKMTFTLNQPGLVAYAWNQSPFSETPMTVTGNVATLELTGLSEGDVINKAVKFVWAAGGFAVTEYFTYTVGDDCTGPAPVTYTVSVDVSETPGGVNIFTNFSGAWAEAAATDMGNNVYSYTFTNVGTDVTVIEYLWKVYTGGDANTQENLIALPGGGGLENHLAALLPANELLITDYANFCNRTVRPDGVGFDAQTYFFNSFRKPGVAYSSVSVTAPVGDNIVMDYSVNAWSQSHGPGTTDNGDGTHTAIIDPSASFEYKWNNLSTPTQEDLLTCTNGDLINTDNFSYANRIFIAGSLSVSDVFGDCPSVAGIEDISANAIKMYPNPAKGVVNFSSASNVALDVAVFDMLGKQVLRANAVQSQLNISSLNPGMYFVKMTQGSNVSTKKLLVN